MPNRGFKKNVTMPSGDLRFAMIAGAPGVMKRANARMLNMYKNADLKTIYTELKSEMKKPAKEMKYTFEQMTKMLDGFVNLYNVQMEQLPVDLETFLCKLSDVRLGSDTEEPANPLLGEMPLTPSTEPTPEPLSVIVEAAKRKETFIRDVDSFVELEIGTTSAAENIGPKKITNAPEPSQLPQNQTEGVTVDHLVSEWQNALPVRQENIVVEEGVPIPTNSSLPSKPRVMTIRSARAQQDKIMIKEMIRRPRIEPQIKYVMPKASKDFDHIYHSTVTNEPHVKMSDLVPFFNMDWIHDYGVENIPGYERPCKTGQVESLESQNKRPAIDMELAQALPQGPDIIVNQPTETPVQMEKRILSIILSDPNKEWPIQELFEKGVKLTVDYIFATFQAILELASDNKVTIIKEENSIEFKSVIAKNVNVAKKTTHH